MMSSTSCVETSQKLIVESVHAMTQITARNTQQPQSTETAPLLNSGSIAQEQVCILTPSTAEDGGAADPVMIMLQNITFVRMTMMDTQWCMIWGTRDVTTTISLTVEADLFVMNVMTIVEQLIHNQLMHLQILPVDMNLVLKNHNKSFPYILSRKKIFRLSWKTQWLLSRPL